MSFIRVRDRDTGHHYSLPEGHYLLTHDLVDVLDRDEPTALHMPPKPNVTRRVAEGEPSETWTVKRLREHADAHGIDLASATTKPEILAAITSTEGA